MTPVLGRVITSDVSYELRSKGWIVTRANGQREPEVERALGSLYDSPRWWGPHLGQPGAAPLHDLATKVGGRVELPPQSPSNPNVDY